MACGGALMAVFDPTAPEPSPSLVAQLNGHGSLSARLRSDIWKSEIRVSDWGSTKS